MEQAEDPTEKENKADWVLDSLVAYLRGPIWITPILNFVEQKSVGNMATMNYSYFFFPSSDFVSVVGTSIFTAVFEGDDSEHENEYRRIHDEFRNLVCGLLFALSIVTLVILQIPDSKVDIMLGAYMDDLGLQPEHLEAALAQIQPSVRSAALQVLKSHFQRKSTQQFMKIFEQ